MKSCQPIQLHDRRHDRLGRAHHQEDGRPHPRRGREGLREEEMNAKCERSKCNSRDDNNWSAEAVYFPVRIPIIREMSH